MRRRSSLLLVLAAVGMGACGAPPEAASPPAPKAAPAPARPAVTAVASASASASAAPVADEPPEPPLLDPLAPLLPGAVARLGTTRMRFRPHTVLQSAITPSGTPLVVEDGGRGTTVRDLWLDRTIVEQADARHAALAPDASFLVTARPKDPVVVISLQPLPSGSARWSVEVKAPRVTQKVFKKTVQVASSVARILVSPNGSHVALVFATGDATVLAAKDGSVAARITAGKGRLEALSRDGAHALFVDDGTTSSSSMFESVGLLGSFGSRPRVKTVHVVDTRTGAVLRKLEPNVVARVTLSPDGREILALWSGSLVAVNVATGARRVLRESDVTAGDLDRWLAPQPSLLLSPDGSRVAISDETTDVVLLADGTVTESGLSGTPLCFSPDGALLLMRSESVARIVGRADDVPDGHASAVSDIAFAAGGKLLVSTGEDVRFWNPRTGRGMAHAPSVKARAVASDPAGEHLVIAAPELRAASPGGTLVDLGPPEPGHASGPARKPHVAHAAPLPGGAAVAVILDSGYLGATGSSRVRLWSATEPAELARAAVASPRSIAAGPDGDRIAVLGRSMDAEVHLLDAKTLEPIRKIPLEGGSDMAVTFAGSDSRLLVDMGWRRGLTLFDADRGVPLARFHGGGCCDALAASRDGRFVAGASRSSVLLWQREPRKLLAVFRGHRAPVKALAFSPDGALLASASEDTSILVWDTSASVPPERPTFTVRVPDATSTRELGPDDGGMLIAERGPAAAKAAGPPSLTGRVRKAILRDDGALTFDDVPGRVQDIRQLAAAGGARCALDGKGDVRCWGWPHLGMLGTGAVPFPKGKAAPKLVDTPQLVKLPAKATGIAGGGSGYVCAVLDDGRLACWGSLLFAPDPGTSGLGALFLARPEVVSGLVDVASVAIGGSFACALEKSGKVLCWGRGDKGQLGTAQGQDSVTPVAVPGIADARALSAGVAHACAVRASGAVTCWGANEHEQLGEGAGIPDHAPKTFGTGFVEVAAGQGATCARQTGGDVLCWGTPGRRRTLPFFAPTQVPEAAGLTDLRMLGDALCGVKNGAEVVCVGFRDVDL